MILVVFHQFSLVFKDFLYFSNFEAFIINFRVNTIKLSVPVTSGTVLLNAWMDLDTVVAVLRRETARVLGLRDAPAEPDIDPARASIQGISSDFG